MTFILQYSTSPSLALQKTTESNLSKYYPYQLKVPFSLKSVRKEGTVWFIFPQIYGLGIVEHAWKSPHARKARRGGDSPRRVSPFSRGLSTRALEFRSLYPWGKMGTTRSLLNLSNQYVSARASCWRSNRRPREKNPRSKLKRIWAGHWTEDLN